MNDTLSIARSPHDLLVSSDGEPVWPIRSPSDEELLRDLADVFGCSLQARDASPGETFPSDEIVLGLGEELRGATRLYAHLTRRRPRVIDSIRELDAVEDAHVLLCGWDQVTFSLLARVYEYGRNRQPIGLVVADGEDSMRRQVLMRSAAACMHGPMPSPAILISDAFNVEELSAPGLSLVGRHASMETLSEALTAGAGTVGMAIHGDGLDSCLGGAKVLCAVKGRSSLDAPSRPDCVAAGYCHRLNTDLESALADERILGSQELRCRIGVTLSCFGISATESLVAAQWSLLRTRLEDGSVGAIVTPWGLAIPSKDLLFQLTEELVAGQTVGESLARTYEYLGTFSDITRVCLFGDPRVRLPRAEDSLSVIEVLRDALEAPVDESAPDATAVEVADTRSARATILAECVRLVASDARPDTEDSRLADEAATALAPLLAEDPECWAAASIERASVAALRALACVGRVWKYFSRLGKRVEPVPCSTHCRACALPLRATHRKLDIPGAVDRLELWCDRCGVVLNTEHDSPFARSTFTFTSGRLVMDTALRAPGVHAMLVLQAWWHGRAVWELSSATSEDVIVAEAVPGVTVGNILAIKDLELIVLQGMFRFAPFPEGSTTPS